MWINVYPNWNTNFNSKIGNKRSFSYETKASISLIPKRRMCLWSLIMKKKVIIMWIDVYPNWNTNFNSKIGNKRSFSFQTKASISLSPSRRMCLWFPIMKRMEIIMWFYVYPNWKMNFNSKNGNKRSFSYDTKASISLIPTRRMCLSCPITKKWWLLYESIFIPIEIRTSILKKVIREVFLVKPKHQYY